MVISDALILSEFVFCIYLLDIPSIAFLQRVGIIDDVFDTNSTNETFILSDGPTPDQAG